MNNGKKMIDLLLNDPDWQVRASLAENETLPDYVYEKLATDIAKNVVKRLSYNKQLPDHIYELLSYSDDHEVRNHIWENNSTPEYVLKAMIGRVSSHAIYRRPRPELLPNAVTKNK